MKIPNIFAVIVAVLVPGLTALGHQAQQPLPDQPPPPPRAITPPADTSTNTPAPAPEPPPPPLPAGRNVSYSPLTGVDTLSATNAPVSEGEPANVSFTETDLTDAIRALALQAGLNIQFDPTLLVAQDGHPIPPPQVTLKWHNLTANQALHALLENYGWQLYWDPRSKVGRIAKKNPAAAEPLIISVYQLSYSDPTNIVKEVQGTLSAGSAIIPDLRTHQLVIRTTERELPGVQALIKKLDSATRQILVEAKIVETSKDITSAKGVDWTGTLASQHVSFGNGLTQGTTGIGSAPYTNSVGGSTVSREDPASSEARRSSVRSAATCLLISPP